MEAGASLVVKRAQPFHGARPSGLERDIVADDIGNIDALTYLVDVSALDQTCHRASLVRQVSPDAWGLSLWRITPTRDAHTEPWRTDP